MRLVDAKSYWGLAALVMAGAFSTLSAAAPDPASVAVASGPALTLKEAVDRAVAISEDLKITQEDVEQANQRWRQAFGAILPELRFQLAHVIQDTSGVKSGSGGSGSAAGSRYRTESKLHAHQPLFAGFKEWRAMKSFKAEAEREDLKYRRDIMVVFENVAQAFYQSIQGEAQFEAINTLIELTDDRAKELRGRTRLGKSRESEVLTAEAQSGSLRSSLEATRGAILASRDNLSFFTGLDGRSVTLMDDVEAPVTLPDMEDAVRRSEQRPDILSFEKDVEAQYFIAKAIRSDYWPTLGVDGNYYFKRPGFQDEINWDVLLDLDVPLYQGGGVSAAAKEADSVWRQSKLDLERLRRQVATDVRRTYTALVSSQRQTEVLKTAYEKARRSFTMQQREYRLGLVTNLDVIQAMNQMQELRRDYDRARLQTKLDWLSLKVAIGEM